MPWPNRDLKEWQEEVDQDLLLIKTYLVDATKPDDELVDERVQRFAMARKEANRLSRDVERIAQDIYGITREELNAVRT